MVNQKTELFQLEKQLCFALYSASRAMIQIYRPWLSGFNLTYPQYLALMVLWKTDGISLGELGRHLHLDSGTLSPLLKRLQSLGFITRERSLEDERELIISLTPSGRDLREQMAKDIGRLVCNIGLRRSEVTALQKEVSRVAEILYAKQPAISA